MIRRWLTRRRERKALRRWQDWDRETVMLYDATGQAYTLDACLEAWGPDMADWPFIPT